MELKELLRQEKRNAFLKANGGLALPAAGFLYWLALGIAGLYLSPRMWFPVAAFTSGLIFPLGLLLAKPLKSDIMNKSALTDLLLPAFISMLMFWPLAFAGAQTNLSFVPLAIGVGMGIHWPVIGWVYGRWLYLGHAVVRTVGATALWYAFPDARFVMVPLFVSGVYLITVFVIKAEVKRVQAQGALQTVSQPVV
ncbi:DUF7010 family protein [Chryseolinea soli]|uniref:Uncharacterized protein n=1 Tax=Chryseolinea soli TaxID=2321403 RepID=A0A385SQH2_9BACT|nr:hypothetical protein [Chryseolinea soli]AYB33234.1 hypothetical protein D4L85_22800 [Chryseolinea soli]